MRHAIVFSIHRNKEELTKSLELLEPQLQGHHPFQDVLLKTDGCQFHCHRFYGSDNRPLYALQSALIGIEEWCDNIPGGMVPAISVSNLSSQSDRNVVRWMSLVYYLASSSQAPYLEIEVECQQRIQEIYFTPWYDCPHPPGWRPFDWLILKGSSVSEFPKWVDKFRAHNSVMPDLIDAYLLDDVIRSSIAAVDILTSVLPMERRLSKKSSNNDVQQLDRFSLPSRKRQKQIVELWMMLRTYHDPSQPWRDPTQTIEEKEPYKPLNATQLAQILRWRHSSGKFADSTVRRVMEELFGQSPSSKYKSLLSQTDRNRRFLKAIETAIEIKGGTYYEQIPSEEISHHGKEVAVDPSKLEFTATKKSEQRSDRIKLHSNKITDD